MRFAGFVAGLVFTALSWAAAARGEALPQEANSLATRFYTLAPVEVRQRPSLRAPVVARLFANETVWVIDPNLRDGVGPPMAEVKVGQARGFVPRDVLSDVVVEVYKAERRAVLLKGTTVVESFPIALGADAPSGDKAQRGDRATPEGRFFISLREEAPLPERYGARSMLLSYPAASHARKGVGAGLIDVPSYKRILTQLRAGHTPQQTTRLGGSIRIHGGGSRPDWTLGCIALSDEHVKRLFALTAQGTRVDVFSSRQAAEEARTPLAARIEAGAREQLTRPALYTERAMSYARLAYPGGDIPPDHAVCSDIVVRAMRAAGLDLQALVYEDRLLRAAAYPRTRAPDWSIDHRRVKNLVTLFDRFAEPVPLEEVPFLPGEIVFFETGIANGSPYDHVGIVSGARASPSVINIWAPGAHTASMPLLGQSYPVVTARYRISARLRGW